MRPAALQRLQRLDWRSSRSPDLNENEEGEEQTEEDTDLGFNLAVDIKCPQDEQEDEHKEVSLFHYTHPLNPPISLVLLPSC